MQKTYTTIQSRRTYLTSNTLRGGKREKEEYSTHPDAVLPPRTAGSAGLQFDIPAAQNVASTIKSEKVS